MSLQILNTLVLERSRLTTRELLGLLDEINRQLRNIEFKTKE